MGGHCALCGLMRTLVLRPGERQERRNGSMRVKHASAVHTSSRPQATPPLPPPPPPRVTSANMFYFSHSHQRYTATLQVFLFGLQLMHSGCWPTERLSSRIASGGWFLFSGTSQETVDIDTHATLHYATLRFTTLRCRYTNRLPTYR
jgi:hypothetical protein